MFLWKDQPLLKCNSFSIIILSIRLPVIGKITLLLYLQTKVSIEKDYLCFGKNQNISKWCFWGKVARNPNKSAIWHDSPSDLLKHILDLPTQDQKWLFSKIYPFFCSNFVNWPHHSLSKQNRAFVPASRITTHRSRNLLAVISSYTSL